MHPHLAGVGGAFLASGEGKEKMEVSNCNRKHDIKLICVDIGQSSCIANKWKVHDSWMIID